MPESDGAAVLLRRRDGDPRAAPIRLVHLGLGAFHRAHQAFYTDQVDTRREWGIAAFTGRKATLSEKLSHQDGLYTLVERSDSGDTLSTVASIVEAVDGNDVTRLAELLAAPTTAIVTLTVTEAGYQENSAVLGRLAAALDARRRADAGPLAVVPCDNVADNAGVIRAALARIAPGVHPDLPSWIQQHVSFVNTCVDRITPATTAEDIAEVERERGYIDNAPVVTEPFHEWVLCGEFPAGRPAWERAGATFVADIRPYETRKLWFLNGAHSLLAYLGQQRGHTTVDEAISDPACRDAVEALWDLAESNLHDDNLDLPTYREHLLQRFANRRISHRLSQIALDGSVKLRNRLVPVVLAAAPTGDVSPALLVLAAWVDYVASGGEIVTDPAAVQLRAALVLKPGDQTRALLTVLVPRWGDDEHLVSDVHALRHLARSSS